MSLVKTGIWRMMLVDHQKHPAPCDDAEIYKEFGGYKRLKFAGSLQSSSSSSSNGPVAIEEELLESELLFARYKAIAEGVSNKPRIVLKPERNVSFSEVKVFEHELILGENPNISFPLMLGWRCRPHKPVSVDTYEEKRKKKNQDECKTRTEALLMPLTLQERRLRLRGYGHSEKSIRRVERKRRIGLVLEWASGQYPKEEPFRYSEMFFLNYIL